jgi:phage tail-like protein
VRGAIPGLISPYPLGAALPAVYQDDQFAQAMLTALDEVLAPIFNTLEDFDSYLDPYLTPGDFLDWLSVWVGISIDETWSLERRRDAVAHAVDLYRLRGTAAGLARQVEIHTGGSVEITENGGTAWSVDPGGDLPGNAAPLLVVRVTVDDPKAIDPARLDALVATAKPAHVGHRVEIAKATGRRSAT